MTTDFSLQTYVGTCEVPHNYVSRSAPLKASAHFAGATERKGNESNWIFNCWNLLERARTKEVKLSEAPGGFTSSSVVMWYSRNAAEYLMNISLSCWQIKPNCLGGPLLTYSMVQSPSWEAYWFTASQEIPRILWNPKVHYRTHKPPPPVPILGHPNPVHIPTSHLLEIHPNIIHPSTPRSPQWSLSLRFPHQDPIHPPLLTRTRHMPSPSHSSRIYHPHNIGWAVQIIWLTFTFTIRKSVIFIAKVSIHGAFTITLQF